MEKTILNPEEARLAKRLYYLDWIRVITIVIVFLFHCCMFFNSYDWHVKNAVHSATIDVIAFTMLQWMMPMFFFISGASTWYALQSKTGGKFLADRVKRILVPLVFGIFILSPHQVYLERLTHHQFNGSFIDFIPWYFHGWYAMGGNFAWMGLHLWYLLLLFIFSLLLLPLFLYLKKRAITTTQLRYPILVLPVFVLLLALPGWLFEPDGMPGGRVWGGWSMFEHLVMLAMGYFAFSRPEITGLWTKYKKGLLILTIILSALNIYLYVNHMMFEFGTLLYLLKILLRATVCFAWILTIMGFAEAKLNYTNKNLKYANQAVLPFYILHQPVLILFGYFIIQTQLAIALKYFIIAIVSFLIIVFIYQFLVQRFNFLRFLFGMGKKG